MSFEITACRFGTFRIAAFVAGLAIVAATASVAQATSGGVTDCTGQPLGMDCPDDGNPCTNDYCDGVGACTHPTQPFNAPCPDDGNDCTHDACNGSGTCTHNPTAQLSLCADDGNECTRDYCNGSGTCVHNPAPHLSVCSDDGNDCTRDFCNGAGVCLHNPAPNLSVCADDGDLCTRDLCNGSGTCLHQAAPDLSPCEDDGKACTTDFCQAGVCTHTGPNSCDGNCAVDPPGTRCTDDGNSCTEDVCAGGVCIHPNRWAGSVCTDDANDCTFDQCNGSGTCEHLNVAVGGACTSDSNDCTFEQCSGAGVCTHLNVGVGGACTDDVNACTFEQCDGTGVCTHLNLNIGGFCHDEGNDCTFDLCSGAGTCMHQPIGNGTGCNDDLDNCTWDRCNMGTVTCDHLAIPSCVTELQTSDQTKCLTGLNGAGVKLSSAQGKANAACIKAALAGDELTPQACLTADASGKVQAAADKVTATHTSKCAVEPDFGARDTAPILATADDERRNLLADLFGASLDGVVSATDEARGKCQSAIAKATEKIVGAKLKSFLKCKKSGLKDTIVSRLGLDDCLLQVGIASADPESSLGKTIAKLTSAREKSCTGVAIVYAFPGECASLGNTPAFDACVDRIAECRACRTVVGIDGPFVNCDVFDDGTGNGTCPVD